MSDQPNGSAMPEPAPPRNRYRGLGGLYVVVDGDTWPADEAGNALAHTRAEDGTPLPPPVAPGPQE